MNELRLCSLHRFISDDELICRADQEIPLLHAHVEHATQEYQGEHVEKQTSSHLLHTIDLIEDKPHENVSAKATQHTIDSYDNSHSNTSNSGKGINSTSSRLEVTNNLVDIEVPLRIELETADGDIQTITLPQFVPVHATTVLANDIELKNLSSAHNLVDSTTVLPAPQNAYIINDVTSSNRSNANQNPPKYHDGVTNKVQILSTNLDTNPNHVRQDTFSLLRSTLISKRKRQRQSRCTRSQLVLNNETNRDTIDGGYIMPALQWIAGITENINEAMHYGCSGKPDALVFQAPQKYFELLRARISEACISGNIL